MKISITTFTHWADKFHMINNLRSLVDLQPDEICILDTTKDDKLSIKYRKWLRQFGEKLGFNMKIKRQKWNGSYKRANNTALKMCTGDWVLRLDSDEIISKEIAKDLRKKLKSLSKEALVLRTHRISILDKKHTIGPIWKEGKRPGKGVHGRIFKLGCGGKYKGSNIHETYWYPGRGTIPWNSPKHPKKDWYGYYIIHLWLYKDNFMRRNWAAGAYNYEQMVKKLRKENKPREELWKLARDVLLKRRGWTVKKIPKGFSWIDIEWPKIGKDWMDKYNKYWNNQVKENIERKFK